ncbi:MarR family transcriptional regulator [Salinadaptatus halalkaliphilus]|uniref:MarR family transcriptional regulator n=1 Tax=Salinadaptatus halalkaliphilus TaxID=2419781 RepID=UPI003743C197
MSTPEHQVTVPDTIDSPATKLVYVAITVIETATVSRLHRLLDLSKLTLLPILWSLVDAGFIQRQEGRYVRR